MPTEVRLDPTAAFLVDHEELALEMVVLEGPCDIAALVDAATESLRAEPTFNARIVETKSRLMTTLALRPLESPHPVSVLDLSGLADTGTDYDAVVAEIFDERLRPRGDHRPMKVTIVELPDDRTMLALEFHHVLADATTLFSFIRTVLAHYHETTTGNRPPWAETETLHSQVTAADTIAPASRRDFLLYAHALTRSYPTDRVNAVHGTPSTPFGQVAARTTLADAATIRALRDRARIDGASLGDVVNAASMAACCEWNAAHEIPVDVLRATVTVAIHARRAGQGGNALSGVAVGARASELDDPGQLLRSLAEQRTAAIAKGIDQRLAMMMTRLQTIGSLRGFGLLPLPNSRRDTGLSTSTFHFSNAGVVWPELVDGRPTGRSAISHVGATEIADVSFRNGLPAPRIGVSVVTIAGQTQLRVTGTTETISQSEIRSFADLVAGHARAFA